MKMAVRHCMDKPWLLTGAVNMVSLKKSEGFINNDQRKWLVIINHSREKVVMSIYE
jgi:hypothetical protein